MGGAGRCMGGVVGPLRDRGRRGQGRCASLLRQESTDALCADASAHHGAAMSAAPEQPPRAADVPVAHIPAGVLEAIDDFEEAAITLHEHRSFATEIDFNIAQAAMLKTIATALREARAHGAADTARLDWIG